MTEKSFIDLVIEELFIRGFNCPNLSLLRIYVAMERQQDGKLPDEVTSFVQKCLELPGVTLCAVAPNGVTASVVAGARERWLAIHEAGHAIVGIEAGFTLRGVRFYGPDGFPGETGFPDETWKQSRDEDLLQRLIRVDVAGYVAEMVWPGDREPPGRLSAHYDDLTPGNRPSDFCSADARAIRLALLRERGHGEAMAASVCLSARRMIVETAESEAEEVLRRQQGGLGRLADRLKHGPISGTEAMKLLYG